VSKGVMVMVRRDTGAKITAKLEEAVESLKSLLDDIHGAMFSKYVTQHSTDYSNFLSLPYD